jgi:hypothetical protein
MMLLVGIGIGIGAGAMSVIAHGGDPTLTHACVHKTTGNLRIIDPNGSCGPSERPLDWTPDGFSRWEIVESTSPSIPPGTAWGQLAFCPAGKRVLGGGFFTSVFGSNEGMKVTQSHPLVRSEGFEDGEAWRVEIVNTSGETGHVGVYAICAQVSL